MHTWIQQWLFAPCSCCCCFFLPFVPVCCACRDTPVTHQKHRPSLEQWQEGNGLSTTRTHLLRLLFEHVLRHICPARYCPTGEEGNVQQLLELREPHQILLGDKKESEGKLARKQEELGKKG